MRIDNIGRTSPSEHAQLGTDHTITTVNGDQRPGVEYRRRTGRPPTAAAGTLGFRPAAAGLNSRHKMFAAGLREAVAWISGTMDLPCRGG